MDLEERIRRLAGAGKRGFPERRRYGIYTSFTLPGLDTMQSLRDTSCRMTDFGMPADLSGATAIDVGSNVGAFSLELAHRGAVVTGIEFCPERVALANEIAAIYGLCAQFFQHDLRTDTSDEWASSTYDIVTCCSVDEYIVDVPALYARLRSLSHSRGTLYLESNIQGKTTERDTADRLVAAGFVNVRYIGNGQSGGVSRKRKLFTATIGD